MALTFPLSLAQFMDRLPIGTCMLHCPSQVQTARTGGGEVLPADVGPQLWTAKITLGKMEAQEARPVRALLGLIGRAGATVMAYDTSRAYPLADPGGFVLGVAAPTIASLSTDGRELTLDGLPPGYVLSTGDMLAFAYGANPVRYALHEMVNGCVASAGGTSAEIEVSPPLREGAAIGAAVSLSRPSCKMQLVPGSHAPGTAGATITQDISFNLIQTLR